MSEEIRILKEIVYNNDLDNYSIDDDECYLNGYARKCLKKVLEEIERLNNIINEVYEYLDKKKDVPEWWDTDFMICMDILKGGTGNLEYILGSDKE